MGSFILKPMEFKTYTTPKGNTFKMITETDTVQIGYHMFTHNYNPELLRTENLEMESDHYIGICFCAKVLPNKPEGMDLTKSLRKKFPVTEWMQLDPTYAFCTIGINMDVRLLRDTSPQGKARFNDLFNSFCKFIFKDIYNLGNKPLIKKEIIEKDIKTSLINYLGLKKTPKVVNWDEELTKLMGGDSAENKEVE
jgi:hypothetical protein